MLIFFRKGIPSGIAQIQMATTINWCDFYLPGNFLMPVCISVSTAKVQLKN